MSTDDSKRLLSRIRLGDEEAAAEVFDRYLRRLLALIRRRTSPSLERRVDAEDVVQSAMRSFFVRAGNEEYVLQRAGDLWRLLATIALHKLRRQVEVHSAAKRAVSRERAANEQLGIALSLCDRQPLPEEEASLTEQLQLFLLDCSEPERQALQQRLAGETIEAIADSMGRSHRTVRRLLQTCRQRLEQRLATGDL